MAENNSFADDRGQNQMSGQTPGETEAGGTIARERQRGLYAPGGLLNWKVYCYSCSTDLLFFVCLIFVFLGFVCLLFLRF